MKGRVRNCSASFVPPFLTVISDSILKGHSLVVGDICEALSKIESLFLVSALDSSLFFIGDSDFFRFAKMTQNLRGTTENSLLPPEVSRWFSQDYFGDCRVGRLRPLITD